MALASISQWDFREGRNHALSMFEEALKSNDEADVRATIENLRSSLDSKPDGYRSGIQSVIEVVERCLGQARIASESAL